jgi:hypothetical protein
LFRRGGDSHPEELVVVEPSVCVHPGVVAMEVQEGPGAAIEDAGSALDETGDGPEPPKQVTDTGEIGRRRMPHDCHGRRQVAEAAPVPGGPGFEGASRPPGARWAVTISLDAEHWEACGASCAVPVRAPRSAEAL